MKVTTTPSLRDGRAAVSSQNKQGDIVEAWSLDFPGCIVQAKTFEEAFAKLDHSLPFFKAKLREIKARKECRDAKRAFLRLHGRCHD